MTIDKSLNVRVKVSLRLLDTKEGVVPFALVRQPIEFNALEGEED